MNLIKKSTEFYSEIFADINMTIAEFTYYCYKCKIFFISHNKLHDHIHIKCKLSVQSLNSAVFKNNKLIIIKSIIKSKKLSEYSFKK